MSEKLQLSPIPFSGPTASPKVTWGQDYLLAPCPTLLLLRPVLGGGWAHAIVCALVGWHGNSEQEAGRSLIAICQAECQDRDGKKKQHQKKEVLASACCGPSHSLTPQRCSHHRGKSNLTWCRGQAVSSAAGPERERSKRAAPSQPKPRPPALRFWPSWPLDNVAGGSFVIPRLQTCGG